MIFTSPPGHPISNSILVMAIHHVSNLKDIPKSATSALKSIALLMKDLETSSISKHIQNMVTTQLSSLSDNLKTFLANATHQIDKVVNNNLQSLACLLDEDYTSQLMTAVSDSIQARLDDMITPFEDKLAATQHMPRDYPNQIAVIC